MSVNNKVNLSQSTNSTDPYSDEWLNQSDDVTEFSSEEDISFMSDAYMEGGASGPAQGSSAMKGFEAAEQIKQLYHQIKKDPQLDNVQKNKLLKELHTLFDTARSYCSKNVPMTLLGEISVLEAASISQAPTSEFESIEEEEEGINLESLKTELSNYKAQIQENANLSETKKQQYISKIDQWMSALDLKTLDAETLLPLLEEMKEEVTQASAFSPVVQSLAESTGADPEEIQSAFEAKGLNPSHLPTPPSEKVLQVLVSLSDGLEGKLQAVKDAVKNRTEEIKKQTDNAKAQNASNTACSSDNDNTDLKAFQFLYDAKHHQDSFSKEVATAMRSAGDELATLLNAAYPGSTISSISAAEGEGFNDIEKDYNTAGLLSFNGTRIDLFKAADGVLQASSTVDVEAEVAVVGVRYDWEGSGDWEDGAGRPSLETYGEDMERSKYDTGW